MKITITKSSLVRGLQLVVPVASTKSTLPVLTNILVDATDLDNKGLVKLSANDLEKGIECYVAATITEKGSITIPATKFNEIVKELPDGNINITEDNLQIKVVAGKSKFNLVGLSTRDFPSMVKQDEKELKIVALNADIFADMLLKTMFSASRDMQKYVLTGICLDFKGTDLHIATTDGRRLSYAKYTGITVGGNSKDMQVIVPIKAVTDIIRLISATQCTEGTVKGAQFAIGDNVLTITVGDITFQTRLIEGLYPNYMQVIPKQDTKTTDIQLPVGDLLQAIKQVSLLAGETSPSVNLSFSENKLEVYARSDKGEGNTELEIVYTGKEPFEMAFNPIFLREVLQSVGTGFVTISVSGAQAPTKFTIEGQDYIYIVMPMKR